MVPGQTGISVCYLVHDLDDPAVERRVRSLLSGAPGLTLFGFRRSAQTAPVAGVKPVELGRTADARLARRAVSVALAILRLPRWGRRMRGADVVVARQLEMLLVAAVARRCFAPRAALVFECLDIHRAMLANGPASHGLRWLERRLLRRCQLLIVSAPDFVARYFRPQHGMLPDILLLENKPLTTEANLSAQLRPLPGPPWRIGWFGVLRCQRSLDLLTGLARQCPGQVEIVLHGRPAHTAIPDFDHTVANTPGLRFGGSYDRATDLPALYSGMHFNWTLDFYEAGGNSDWLLPNRLYEGGAFGCVALALADSPCGRWLAQAETGVLLDEPLAEALARFIAGLTPDRYRTLAAAAAAVPADRFVSDAADQARLHASLAALAAPSSRSARSPIPN